MVLANTIPETETSQTVRLADTRRGVEGGEGDRNGGRGDGVKIRKWTGTGITGTFPGEVGTAGRVRGVGRRSPAGTKWP